MIAIIDGMKGCRQAFEPRGSPFERLLAIRDFGIDAPGSFCNFAVFAARALAVINKDARQTPGF